MKVLVVLLILGLVGVYANDAFSDTDTDTQITHSCFQEYGENLDALLQALTTKEELVEKVTPYKTGCISSCYVRRRLPDIKDVVKHVIYNLNNLYKVCKYLIKDDMYGRQTCGDLRRIDTSTWEFIIERHSNKGDTKVLMTFTEAQMDEFKDIASKCAIIEAVGDDCELFKCLKPWDSRIGGIITIP